MADPVIRARTPRQSVEAPAPAKDWNMKWPNGAGVYSAGGAPKVEHRLGWTFKKDGAFQVYECTGPTDEDAKFLGTAESDEKARAMLPETSWYDRLKKRRTPPSASRARAPSPPAPSSPSLRPRKRVPPPAQA